MQNGLEVGFIRNVQDSVGLCGDVPVGSSILKESNSFVFGIKLVAKR